MKLADIEVIAFQLENILGDIQTFKKSMSNAAYLFQKETLPVWFMLEKSFNLSS